MGFTQKARLPLYFTRMQLPATSSVFRLANGSLKVQSVVVRKTFEAETDWMPASWLEALRIALMHNHVSVESTKLIGGVALEGDTYAIQWNEYRDYPTAKVEFTVQVDGYDMSNSNCVSCDAANQLNLTDDNLGVHVEGSAGAGNVFSNDQIFCDPVTASIITYSTIVLAAPPTITNQGAVSFVLNSPLPDATVYHIFTYRVTCPDGSYDDADVFIGIDGSLAGCSPPANVRDASPPSYNTHTIIWDVNDNSDDGYYWELYEADNLGLVVLSGTPSQGSPEASFTGLEPCTDYRFFVRSICQSASVESAFAEITFSTDCLEQTCGQYEVGYDDGTAERNSINFTFMACNGSYRTLPITNTQTRLVCMLQSEPGQPVDLVSGGITDLQYIGIC